jgi:hypothetical protein
MPLPPNGLRRICFSRVVELNNDTLYSLIVAQFISCEVCNDIQWVATSLPPIKRSSRPMPPLPAVDSDDIIFTGSNPAPPQPSPPDLIFMSTSLPRAPAAHRSAAHQPPAPLPLASEPFRCKHFVGLQHCVYGIHVCAHTSQHPPVLTAS